MDVSRGCVLTGDSGIKVTSEFTATLLWMDDEPLENGKDFFVKLGTGLIPGTVSEIRYAVDVNTGEKKPVDVLAKNEIASCRIHLIDKIVADEFTNHKTFREICERQLNNMGGGILTLRAGSKERAYKLINALKYVKIATNIGYKIYHRKRRASYRISADLRCADHGIQKDQASGGYS